MNAVEDGHLYSAEARAIKPSSYLQATSNGLLGVAVTDSVSASAAKDLFNTLVMHLLLKNITGYCSVVASQTHSLQKTLPTEPEFRFLFVDGYKLIFDLDAVALVTRKVHRGAETFVAELTLDKDLLHLLRGRLYHQFRLERFLVREKREVGEARGDVMVNLGWEIKQGRHVDGEDGEARLKERKDWSIF